MVPADRSRRALVKTLGLAGVAMTMGSVPAWALPRAWVAADDEVIPFTDVPANFQTKRGEAPFRLDLRELRSFITPNEQYFAVQHYNVPTIEATSWKLETGGLAAQAPAFTLEQVKRRPRVEKTLAFECSGNQASITHGMIGNAKWTGTPLKDLLGEMKPAPGAREVIFWGADQGEENIRNNRLTMHFARSMSLDDAMKSDALLAYEMNSEPLPVGHGFPLRLVVPGWYGVANVKWLTKIELSDTRLENRFMGRDYVTIMGRQVGDHIEYTETSVSRQRVKSVVARVTRSGDTMHVFGVAWSDGTPLKTVDVQLDGGDWRPAKLDAPASPFAWTFFTVDLPIPPPGEHKLVSRAADRDGRVQPARLELKKTYWEDNAQFTRTINVPTRGA